MKYWPLILAILLIVSEIISVRKNRVTNADVRTGRYWKSLYRWQWLIGFPFAAASLFVSYSYSGETETYRILGFPLPAVAFDSSGLDYVSVLTVPWFIVNAAIWYFLPQLILVLLSYTGLRYRAADA